MRNIRKVNRVIYTTGTGDDVVNYSEIYESEGATADRYNVLMNRGIEAEVVDMYEVGANLGVFAGTLVSSLESAERMAEHKYGEARLVA
jgi:hypothetical protein